MTETRAQQFQFFASPEEQRRWLARRLSAGAWCCAQRPGFSRLIGVEHLEGNAFNLPNDDGSVLYIGHSKIAAPVWSEMNGHVRLDYVRSGAVQFAPSVLLPSQHILLEGRLARPDLRKVTIAELNAEEVDQWFRDLCDTFMSEVRASGCLLFQVTPHGTRKVWRDVWITSGAANLDRDGVQLKQFAEGAVEFHLTREA